MFGERLRGNCLWACTTSKHVVQASYSIQRWARPYVRLILDSILVRFSDSDLNSLKLLHSGRSSVLVVVKMDKLCCISEESNRCRRSESTSTVNKQKRKTLVTSYFNITYEITYILDMYSYEPRRRWSKMFSYKIIFERRELEDPCNDSSDNHFVKDEW